MKYNAYWIISGNGDPRRSQKFNIEYIQYIKYIQISKYINIWIFICEIPIFTFYTSKYAMKSIFEYFKYIRFKIQEMVKWGSSKKEVIWY